MRNALYVFEICTAKAPQTVQSALDFSLQSSIYLQIEPKGETKEPPNTIGNKKCETNCG